MQVIVNVVWVALAWHAGSSWCYNILGKINPESYKYFEPVAFHNFIKYVSSIFKTDRMHYYRLWRNTQGVHGDPSEMSQGFKKSTAEKQLLTWKKGEHHWHPANDVGPGEPPVPIAFAIVVNSHTSVHSHC